MATPKTSPSPVRRLPTEAERLRAEVASLTASVERLERLVGIAPPRPDLRAARLTFSDDDVADALEAALDDAARGREALVRTRHVAFFLRDEEARDTVTPTHSETIRVGLALGRLARAGRVVRLHPVGSRPDRIGSRWTLPGRDVPAAALKRFRLESGADHA